jgi:hypothetical protein
VILKMRLGAALGALLLLVVLWSPTATLREPIPVIGFAAVLFLGLEAIRRQTRREFPDARAGALGRVLRRSAAPGSGAR